VAGASATVAVVPGAGAVVVIIARPGPGHGLRIIVLFIVVVPLRSRTFHGDGLGFFGVLSKFFMAAHAYPQQRDQSKSTEFSWHCCREKHGITEILLTYLILQTPSQTLETSSTIFPLHTPAAT